MASGLLLARRSTVFVEAIVSAWRNWLASIKVQFQVVVVRQYIDWQLIDIAVAAGAKPNTTLSPIRV